MELRCGGCGYGAVVAHALDRCPMCRTNAWQVVRELTSGARSQPAWRPVDVPDTIELELRPHGIPVEPVLASLGERPSGGGA